MAVSGYGELQRRGASCIKARKISTASSRELCTVFKICKLWQMVHVNRERQFVECLENSVRRLDLSIQGGELRPLVRHHGGRQVHRDWIRGQEGVRVRGHLLESDKFYARDKRHLVSGQTFLGNIIYARIISEFCLVIRETFRSVCFALWAEHKKVYSLVCKGFVKENLALVIVK